jgi:hypothetical protein
MRIRNPGFYVIKKQQLCLKTNLQRFPQCNDAITTDLSVLDEMANPMPILVPEGEDIAVLTPITSPLILNNFIRH